MHSIMSSTLNRAISNLIRQSRTPNNFLSKNHIQKISSTPIEMASKPTYKLKYFNFRVLGEPIRWQFALAGVPFEDERLPRDTWDSDNKNKLGWGRLPILEIDGKTQISQSAAISRYLAKEFNLLPETNLQKARCDELVDNLQDLRMLWRPWVRETEPTKKAELEKEMKDVHFPFYLPKVEQFIKVNGGKNGFAVGEKLTWADLYLANFLEIWTDNHGNEILEKFPLLRNHKSVVLSVPQIKEWNSKRFQSKF